MMKSSTEYMIWEKDINQKTKLLLKKASSLLASLLVMPHVPMLYVRVGSVYALYSLIRPPSLTFCLRNQNVIILQLQPVVFAYAHHADCPAGSLVPLCFSMPHLPTLLPYQTVPALSTLPCCHSHAGATEEAWL